ncbi:MAG TPA: glycosyltransferase [Candidatus Eisenbacteria bacterium]|nr:glycosyltransferase [Candidatus Eisenbacteria bacterium]
MTEVPKRPFDSLRVALVHDWLTGMRGGEKCLEVLCERFPHADLFTFVHRPGSVAPVIERRRVVESWIARLPLGRSRYRWFVPLYPRAVESFDLTPYDLVISLSHCAAKGAIARPDALHVCYCFTPVRYFWDLYGEYFGPGRAGLVTRAAASLIAPRFREWDRATSGRVHLFVADSNHVRDRIAAHYGRPAAVVYPPVDTAFFTPAPPAGGPTAGAPLLIVSALVPYKGVERTIRVANRLQVPLRIVGTGPEEARLRRLAGPTVRFDGWLSAEALREAYRTCRALVQAHEEDFGIAPLEAMACGRPAVALARGGASEVVADGTGILYDGDDDAALEAAIGSLAGRAFDPIRLRRHAETFDRERYRERMDSLLRAAWSAFEEAEGEGSAVERRLTAGWSPGLRRRPGASCRDGSAGEARRPPAPS